MTTPAGELEHRYGERVHVLDNPLLWSACARISSADVSRVELYAHLRLVYTALAVKAFGEVLPAAEQALPTRMVASQPEAGVVRGRGLDPSTEVVLVDVIRGGIVPAQLCFELLEPLLPDRVRIDHLNLARATDADGRVTGADLSGSKVGGSVEGATLVLPDPMGATGSTLLRAVEHYLEHWGRPARIVTLTLIATPEFLRAAMDGSDLLEVYTARLDRGLSPTEVLDCVPGERWAEERGLDDNAYIVPGAGGVGEILNNSWC
ncbi:MAG: uracil phosphoribosyltransferase [Planctomycetota bacterium]